MIDANTARHFWNELHTNAKGLKSNLDQKRFMANWLLDVEAALGCSSCWGKVKRFCARWPVAYGEELWLWSICLHDYVNKEMGRPLFYPDITLAPLKQKGIIQ